MKMPPSVTDVNPQKEIAELAEIFRTPAKTAKDRQIGLEVERIGIWPDATPFRYTALPGQKAGARQLLESLSARFEWGRVENEKGDLLGFSSPYGKVSLEPGSQVELSAIPCRSVGDVKSVVGAFEADVESVSQELDLCWLGLGVNPFHRVEDIDVIPSTRYHIMTDYLGRKGRLATAMMRLTSSVQVNLDYSNESEAIEMLRSGLAVTPVSYALFGNSPWFRQKDSEFLSFRSQIWRETDLARSGLLPWVFRDGFDFDAYAVHLWTEPLMFSQNQDLEYVAAEGMSLADYRVAGDPNIPLNAENRMNAVREMFPEVRLKPGYVEVRAIDGQTPEIRYAAAAFWVGLLYSQDARRAVLELMGKWDPQIRDQLWIAASRVGLKARWAGFELLEIARECLSLARAGLKERRMGEEVFLEPVEALFAEKLNPADALVRTWQMTWLKDPEKFIRSIPA